MKKFVLLSALLTTVSFANNGYEVKGLGNGLDINAGLGVEGGYGRVVKLTPSEEAYTEADKKAFEKGEAKYKELKENYSVELNFGFLGYVGISVGGRFGF